MTVADADLRERAGEESAARASAEPLDWAGRLSDRCNPILVREVQQSVGSRAFVATLATSLAAVLVLALSFGWLIDGGRRGQIAFGWCLVGLAPCVLLFVPMQAFASMRQEVSGGTVEQLLLTRLRPMRIVLGKALAGLAQCVLFLGVFAPLMSLTFLLGGIDVATIAVTLGFAVAASLTATMFAIAMGSVGGNKTAQNAMQSAAAAGLFVATFGSMGIAFDLAGELGRMLQMPDAAAAVLAIVVAFAMATILFAMIAAAALAHGYENRSTGFRVYALASFVLVLGWAALADRLAVRHFGEISATFALLLSPFWLWAACEDRRLSPRVQSLVPRRPLLALLAVPFLPGSSRGLAFAALLAAAGVVAGAGIPEWVGASPPSDRAIAALLAWCYVLAIAGFACALRARLPQGRAQSRLAFGTVVVLVVLGAILPFGVALLSGQRVQSWDWSHLSNPMFTVAAGSREGAGVLLPVASIAALLLLVNARSLIGGVTEVLDVSRRRRAGPTRD